MPYQENVVEKMDSNQQDCENDDNHQELNKLHIDINTFYSAHQLFYYP